jgi:dihydrofolate reductase
MFATRTFHSLHGNVAQDGGATGADDEFVARGFHNIGAWIIGRNMFGPVRGPWPDNSWKGWWGDTPPYHTPVFVLTHQPRESLTMKGGTVFHFVTEGIQHALQQARVAADGKDVRLGGGVETLRQYLQAGLEDEMHLAFAPVLLGSGERLWTNLDLPALGYHVVNHVTSANCLHVEITRK